MTVAKLLRIGLVLVMAVSFMAFTGPAIAGDEAVVHEMDITLVPTADAPAGAMGGVGISFMVGSSGELEDFEIDVRAFGLRPGVLHNLFLGNRLIGFNRADIFGRLAIVRALDLDIEDLEDLVVVNRRLPIFIFDDEIQKALLFGDVDIDDILRIRDIERERERDDRDDNRGNEKDDNRG